MSKLLEAAEAAKNLSKHLRGVLLVGEVLERIGTLESEEQQAQQRLEKTKNSLLMAKSELKAAQIDVEKARGEAQAAREASVAEARRFVDEAKANAASITSLAQAEAKRMVDAAADASARTREEAVALAEKAHCAVDEGRKLREELDRALSARQAEFDALGRKLAEVKTEAARIFGLRE